MRDSHRTDVAKRGFIGLWLVVLVLKLALAARLPLFVDEAFYWQEGRHLAWAYSDLPGMTAWLARLGDALGDGTLALRMPFLAIAAWIPWLVAWMTARVFDAWTGWLAGALCLLLPLSGSLGLLAVPDVPLLLASVLCVDAGLRLLQRVDGLALVELAAGLVIGGLTHYRFAAVIAAGGIALLLLRDGRMALRDQRVWAVVALGALAWWPLLHWNLVHGDAGLRFQLLDRHPWSFSRAGIRLGLKQLLLATPLLVVAMGVAVARCRHVGSPAARFLACFGGVIVLGFLLLGFFSDRERVSFHWPLAGHVALLPLLPAVLAGWSRTWRSLAWLTAGMGLAAVLGFHALAAVPTLRAMTASRSLHPTNFAGWQALDVAVRDELATMPPGTVLLAGDFKLGAELGFARGDARIPVLDHPINHKHGRAAQLALWQLVPAPRLVASTRPMLLAVSSNDVDLPSLQAYYRSLCTQFGPLPPPRVLNIDHGRQRFLLFAFAAGPRAGPCTTPASAWLQAPAASANTATSFEVTGMAVMQGVGMRRIDVLLDAHPIANARLDVANASLLAAPGAVAFRARVAGVAPGPHWLGLRLHGDDGRTEDWSERYIDVR